MLVGFMFYTVLRWYRYKKTNKIIKEEEFINYDDTVVIKTEKVPVIFECSSEIGLTDFKIPSSVATMPKPTDCTPEDVQISMYTPSEDCLDVDIKKNEEKAKPKLSFSLHFDADSEELTVSLIRARFITTQGSKFEESNQHITISVVIVPDGTIHHSSQGIAPNPLFKNKFIFSIKGTELQQSKLKFNVWMIDKYSRKMPFGESVVELERIFKSRPITTHGIEGVWWEIESKDELANETAHGELLVSLQHLPGAEKININVMKGRDLKFEEFDKDIYIKVSALTNGKICKNKKTSSVKKTANPIFNETTSFSLSPKSPLTVDNMVVILSVYAYRSRGPHKRLLGRLYVGESENASKLGKEHWHKMVENPSKMIAEWQHLH
eukprot:gene13160-3957_t